MSISSDVEVTRQKALQVLYSSMIFEYGEILKHALNNMSNSELASRLNKDCDLYFHDVKGKGKLE